LHTAGKFQEGQMPLAAIHGICSDIEDVLGSGARYAARNRNRQVHLIYQGSNGFIVDVLHAAINYLGIRTSASKTIEAGWGEIYATSGNQSFHTLAHSWGGLLAAQALKSMPGDMKQRMRIDTIGSPFWIEPGECGRVTNTAMRGDPVGWLNVCAWVAGRRAEVDWREGTEHALWGPGNAQRIYEITKQNNSNHRVMARSIEGS
jgi:hypothetical protein